MKDKNEAFLRLTGISNGDIAEYLYNECNFDKATLIFAPYLGSDGWYSEFMRDIDSKCLWMAHSSKDFAWTTIRNFQTVYSDKVRSYGVCIGCGDIILLSSTRF